MENNYEYVQETQEKQGSIVRGLVGAILGAVIGAVLWCVIGVVTGYMYSLIGFVVGLLVGFGYDLFKGRKGTIRTVVMLVSVIISLVVGSLLTEAYFLHDAYVSEVEFAQNASKQELIEFYSTEEELAEYHALPAPLKAVYEQTFYVELYSELEVFQMSLANTEYVRDVLSNCVQSIFFGLLGSFTLILNNGKKKSVTNTKAVNFDEALSEEADTNEGQDTEA